MRQISSRTTRLVSKTFLVLTLAACASASEPEKIFEELCQKEAGLEIFEKASRVESFFDRGFTTEGEKGVTVYGEGCIGYCWFMLTRGYHKFVEAEVTPRPENPFEKDVYAYLFVTGPGLYRFWLEKPGHPDCRNFEAITSLRPVDRERARDLAGRCLASRRIDKPVSRYEFGAKQTHAFRIPRVVTIFRHEQFVRDRIVGHLLAANTSFGLSPIDGRNRWCPRPREILQLEDILSPK